MSVVKVYAVWVHDIEGATQQTWHNHMRTWQTDSTLHEVIEHHLTVTA